MCRMGAATGLQLSLGRAVGAGAIADAGAGAGARPAAGTRHTAALDARSNSITRLSQQKGAGACASPAIAMNQAHAFQPNSSKYKGIFKGMQYAYVGSITES